MATGACHTGIPRQCRSLSSEPSWCARKPVNGDFRTALFPGPSVFSIALFFVYKFCLGIVRAMVFATASRTASLRSAYLDRSRLRR